jgi:hypothetical protein
MFQQQTTQGLSITMIGYWRLRRHAVLLIVLGLMLLIRETNTASAVRKKNLYQNLAENHNRQRDGDSISAEEEKEEEVQEEEQVVDMFEDDTEDASLKLNKKNLYQHLAKEMLGDSDEEQEEEEAQDGMFEDTTTISGGDKMSHVDTDEAYLKCYNVLDGVSGDDTVNQEEYLEFLGLMTNGDLFYNRFRDLPATFVSIFYATACSAGQDCINEDPTVAVTLSGVEGEWLNFFCKSILKNTFTEAEVTFEYTVRYDSSVITEDELFPCLEQGTENALLDQLAGCPVDTGDEDAKLSRRLSLFLQGSFGVHTRFVGTAADDRRGDLDRTLEEETGSSDSSDDDPDDGNNGCPYQVSCTVDGITQLREF